MTNVPANPGDVVLILSIEDATRVRFALDKDSNADLAAYVTLAIEQAIRRSPDTILPHLRDPWANGALSSREGASLLRTESGAYLARPFDPTDQDPT